MNPDFKAGAVVPAQIVLPKLWLLRHGETEWSRSGQYTGLTDLPLTENGREQARLAGNKLVDVPFDAVFSSPSMRAVDTSALAGFSDPEILPFAHEWDYGEYEGVNSADIRAQNPDYLIWNDGVPGGETLAQVAARADKVIARVQADSAASSFQNVLLVAHGHFLRVLAARWCQLEAIEGRRLVLTTAAVCMLGWDKRTPAIEKWNL